MMRLGSAVLVSWVLAICGAAAQTNPPGAEEFSFVVAGDMRSFVGPAPAGKRYFDGACEAMKAVGPGAFLISPGDVDPPGPVRSAIDACLGSNFVWYPVVGNHEIENQTNMVWLRQWAQAGIPHLKRRGPPGAEETTYSFEFANSHFVVLNDYYDGHSDSVRHDDVPTAALEWLKQDLGATDKPLRWVVAHTPLKSLPDMDTGRLRHPNDFGKPQEKDAASLAKVLKDFHVRAYFCGHTHNCSIERVKGVWQADSGHARGGGDPGSPSTFLKVRVTGPRAWVEVYRSDPNGEHYRLRKTVELD